MDEEKVEQAEEEVKEKPCGYNRGISFLGLPLVPNADGILSLL